jgi:hypothetical protein
MESLTVPGRRRNEHVLKRIRSFAAGALAETGFALVLMGSCAAIIILTLLAGG